MCSISTCRNIKIQLMCLSIRNNNLIECLKIKLFERSHSGQQVLLPLHLAVNLYALLLK